MSISRSIGPGFPGGPLWGGGGDSSPKTGHPLPPAPPKKQQLPPQILSVPPPPETQNPPGNQSISSLVIRLVIPAEYSQSVAYSIGYCRPTREYMYICIITVLWRNPLSWLLIDTVLRMSILESNGSLNRIVKVKKKPSYRL